jgi:autotransporter-associated beta strand protein
MKLTSGTAIAATAGGLGAASNTVTFNGGTLQYAIANATDYSGRFATTGGQPIRIDTNGQNVTFATALAGAGTSLTKLGFGKLTLGNVGNNYTGGTTVSNGTLLANVAGAAPTSGTLAVAAGGTFSMANGAAVTTYTTDTLNLASGATLAFDWVGAAADTLTSTNAAATTGSIGISLTPITSPSGTPTLLSSPSGGLKDANSTKYFLANNNNYKAALTVLDTSVSIGTYSAVTALANAYWKGGQVVGATGTMAFSDGTVSNWATDPAGTGTALVPGSTSVNAFFSATNASQQGSLVLGADMSFGTMTFNDANAVTIAGGNAITLSGTGTGAASAIYVSSTSNAATTINSGVILGAAQTWTVANGKTLAVGGPIGATSTYTLTKARDGTLVLSGANSYTGATIVGSALSVGIVQGGTLRLDMDAGGSLYGTTPYSALTFTGGNFEVKGKASGATAQILGNLTLTASTANKIVLNPNNGDGTTLILADAWTRGAGSSLLIDYSSANTGARQVVTANPTTTYAVSNGVYGGILVKDSAGVTGFATRTAGLYMAMTRYDDTTATALASNSNVAATNFTTRNITHAGGNGGTFFWTGAGNRSVNSLTIDTTTNYGTIDMGPAANILTLTSLGVLFKGGNPETLTGGQVGATNSEVIVHQAGAGTMTINSLISSGTGLLTKDGDGVLVVGGASTYTGATTVNAGTLMAGVATVPYTSGAFGNNSPVTLANVAGATLDANSLDIAIGDLAGGTFEGPASVGGWGGTFNLYRPAAGSISQSFKSLTNVSAGAVSINALKSTGAGTINIGTGDANSLSIKSGMILSTNTLIINGPGKLTSGNGQDLIIYNSNTVTVNAPITGSIGLTKAGAGILSLTSAASDFNGSIYDQAGTLDFNPTGTATYANAISGLGAITKSGSNTLNLTKPVSIGGTFRINAGGGTVNGMNLCGGPGGGSNSGDGANATLNVLTGGTATTGAMYMGGNGTIGGAVSVDSGGHLSPGASVGMVTVNGNVSMGVGGIYHWQLADAGGAAAGTDWDLIEAANITFDGTWKLNVLDDILTSGDVAGKTFLVAQVTGAFTDFNPANVQLIRPAGWSGGTLSLANGDKDLVLSGLSSLTPGDTNADGVVDAADFITLKKNFGKNVGDAGAAAGNLTTPDTNVDWADLSILMNNIGTGGGAPATAPEPATLGLLAIGALVLLRRKRKA